MHVFSNLCESCCVGSINMAFSVAESQQVVAVATTTATEGCEERTVANEDSLVEVAHPACIAIGKAVFSEYARDGVARGGSPR